jgi:predicted Zn-dependent protease
VKLPGSGRGSSALFDGGGKPVSNTDIGRAVWAHKDGRHSSGHASGGPRTLPGIGPHAVVVAPGQGGDLQALFRALGRGLYVQRFSGTVDSASGDFSGVAKSARWIENAVSVRSLKETLISANAFELLRGSPTLASASERIMGVMRAPAALVDGVTVTAG